MHSIVIVGAGNIGCRHLQSLSNLDNLYIQVIDVEKSNYDRAEDIFWKSCEKGKKITLKYSSELSQIEKNADVAIIATSSGPRKSIVKYIIENTEIKNLILEKVLFQSIEDLDEIEVLLAKNDVKAWVNCIRRNMSFYKDIKEKLSGEAYVNMTVDGKEWGLGSNGIHMLDLYGYLTSEKEFIANNEYLDKDIRESKRQGYVEFTGEEIISCKKGMLQLRSILDGGAYNYITISSPNYFFFVDEPHDSVLLKSSIDGWKMQEIKVHFDYVSEVACKNVKDIIENGKCDLTKFEESEVYHKVLIGSFLNHMVSVNGKDVKICPIT